MFCFQHFAVGAAGTCNACGRALCHECVGRFVPPLCPLCAEDEAQGRIAHASTTLLLTAGCFAAGMYFAVHYLSEVGSPVGTRLGLGAMLGLSAASACLGLRRWRWSSNGTTVMVGPVGFILGVWLFRLLLPIFYGSFAWPFLLYQTVRELRSAYRLRTHIPGARKRPALPVGLAGIVLVAVFGAMALAMELAKTEHAASSSAERAAGVGTLPIAPEVPAWSIAAPQERATDSSPKNLPPKKQLDATKVRDRSRLAKGETPPARPRKSQLLRAPRANAPQRRSDSEISEHEPTLSSAPGRREQTSPTAIPAPHVLRTPPPDSWVGAGGRVVIAAPPPR